MGKGNAANFGGKKAAPFGSRKSPATNRKKNAKVKRVMDEWKAGTLHSGSKKGPLVKSQDQAVAIAMSQSGQSPKKKSSNRKR